MDKIWIKHYPATVPAEVDLNEFKSVGDLFEKSVKLYGPRKAYINMDKALTYAELEKLSANVGAYGYTRNWMYLLQRLTGVLAFGFTLSIAAAMLTGTSSDTASSSAGFARI